MRKPRHPSENMEREVIIAVIMLYLLIMLVMLAVHYLQPSGTETKTSSMSPSHSSLKGDAPEKAGSGDAVTNTAAASSAGAN